jgi:hypothetical protein
MEVLAQNGYKVIHLTDGFLLPEAIEWVERGKADGINLNFVRNFPASINLIKGSKKMRFLAINDYDHKKEYDYSAIHFLTSLEHLSVYTTDNKEIDYSAFPLLNSTAIMWRPKARSLFEKTSLKRLFLGRFKGQDLMPLQSLKELEYLRLNTGSVVSLKGIESFNGLEELLLMQLTKLEDINSIQHLERLKYLRIDNCKKIKNIEAIKRLSIPTLEIAGTTPN